MKKCLISILILLFVYKVNGQTYTQTYVDKCTGEVKTVTTTYVNGNAVVSFYNQVRTFTPIEVANGTVQTWLNTVFAQYSSMACPTSQVVQQTVQNTVSQAASQAASTAASTAASSSASSAASSSASSAASSSASTSSSTPPSTSNNTSSSSQSSNSSSSSSESKTETKTETKSESKSETKSESKEESKSESKSEEKKEESKEEKKEEKKKNGNLNPMMFASDLTAAQNPDKRLNMIVGLGWSRASMAGDETFSANAMIWSNLKQFALSGGYTKMEFEEGTLKAIHSYGTTFAYLDGNFMNLLSYTYVRPNPKYGTYGYNLGAINLVLRNTTNTGFDYNVVTSAVGFWTKPYSYSKKITLSPQVFIMTSPISYNTQTKKSSVNRNLGFLLGSSIDYKLSKRFGLSLNYKLSVNTMPNSPILHNVLIGSRMIL
jgi:hypothetical protein